MLEMTQRRRYRDMLTLNAYQAAKAGSNMFVASLSCDGMRVAAKQCDTTHLDWKPTSLTIMFI